MKKTILIGLSAVLTMTASAPAFSQAQPQNDPLFTQYNCNDLGCVGDLLRVLLLTATEGAFAFGFYNETAKGGVTGLLLKEVEAKRAAVLAAEIEVYEAQSSINEAERARRINSIRSDLSKLKAAADVGDVVTVNTSQHTNNGASADVHISKQISSLHARNASLTESMRISPADLRSRLQEQISANLEEIARLNGRSVVSLTSNYSHSSAVEKFDIYSKDMVPAIEEMERRLKHAEQLPILNQQQIEARIGIAQAKLREAKAVVGNILGAKLVAGTIRVVSTVGGVLMVADAGGRIMFYLGGKDPFMSPLVKLTGAAASSFR